MRAEKLHAEAKGLVEDLMDSVKNGKPIDAKPVHELSSSMLESMERNQYALACLTRIREKRRIPARALSQRKRVNGGFSLGLWASKSQPFMS